ncbi:MAG TPA: carbon monoxide dehydrogenase, partial [Anaerolineae bacterium]|nr:carbon monoxide dehydrogenase [Anaerolineae bacterium]
SLVIGHLLRKGKTPVFAVDADANVNLNEQLGIEVEQTIGGMREDLKNSINANEIPAGMPKETYVEYLLQDTLVESTGFDLLVMGRPEGPGCYCYANNMLRRYIEVLSKNYPYVVIDNEAGMEHLSRRTTQKIDLLLLVTEPTPIGIMTAARIRDLAKDMEVSVEQVGLIINKVNGQLPDSLIEEAKGYSLDVLGTVPIDNTVVDYILRHIPAVQLPEESPTVQAVDNILGKLGI